MGESFMDQVRRSNVNVRWTPRGFTILEMVTVLALFGAVAAIAIPRALRPSPYMEVDHAARAMVNDLEAARMRAMAAKRRVRVAFDVNKDFYAAFMDVSSDRTGAISETAEEARAMGVLVRGNNAMGIPGQPLPAGVAFGAGSVGTGPLGASISGDFVALDSDRVEFDVRGMVTPLGSGGVVYLVHEDDPSAVAAVTISGGGAFQAWRYRNGKWIR